MKILHITSGFAGIYGGIAHALNGLSMAQARQGHEVTVIAATKAGEEGITFKPQDVELVIIKQDIFNKVWNSHAASLRNVIRKRISEFDIIHIHGIWHHPSYVAANVARKMQKPFILSPHGSLAPWCLQYKRVKKKAYFELVQKRQLQHATLVHALTEAERGYIKKLVPDTIVKIVPNGIDIQPDLNENEIIEFRRKYPWIKVGRFILFLGRIHPKKGLDVLVKAFAGAKRRGIEHLLVIAGNDEIGWRSELEKLAWKCGVGKEIYFVGQIEGSEKRCMLETCDFLILPSYSEGFSMAILEAMAHAKPVIFSSGCDMSELINEGIGITANPNETEMEKAILELALNKELSKRMGRKARELVLRKYSWDIIANNVIDMYEEAIEIFRFRG